MADTSHDRQDKKIFRRKPRVPAIQKSLAIFLVSLQGERVVFELKDDSEVSGILEEADRGMNATLADAIHAYPDGRLVELDTAYVLGTSIRYVHFQSHVNPKSLLSNYLKKIERIGKRSQPHTIKDRPKRVIEASSTGENEGSIVDDNDDEGSARKRPSGEIFLGYDDFDANVNCDDNDDNVDTGEAKQV